ncbi:hypothetical protein AMTRI_Chr10g1290 [Amborella trichopoda]
MAAANDRSSSSSATLAFDDIEDFIWMEENKMNIPSERLSQVLDLMRKANWAFRQDRIEEAITLYSTAQKLKPGDPVVLSNRSTAFCKFNQQLRNRSAILSEYEALKGMDPTVYAELALRDAEKVVSIQGDSPKAYYQKAKAFILLERYDEARETVLSGLHVDPFSIPLQVLLHDLERISSGSIARMKHSKPERTDDFECTLCLKLLYEPVTTPCGHSFCRPCLFRSMDHGNKCPMCRTVLFISYRTYPVSVTLNNIIQKNFPEEFAERKAEHKSLTNLDADLMPLFVMDVVLPCQKLPLNIFEPRYRLMVRRIMEGNRRMGMVGIDSATGSIADYACEVEICECEPLPDGRFYLEVEGRRRFRILRNWDQDGYRVAEVEWICDVNFPEGTNERDDLLQMAIGAADLAQNWMMRAREAARTARQSRRAELIEADGIPSPQDPERLSFWLVSNVLKLRPSDRLELLRLRDTRERISRGLIYLRAE